MEAAPSELQGVHTPGKTPWSRLNLQYKKNGVSSPDRHHDVIKTCKAKQNDVIWILKTHHPWKQYQLDFRKPTGRPATMQSLRPSKTVKTHAIESLIIHEPWALAHNTELTSISSQAGQPSLSDRDLQDTEEPC